MASLNEKINAELKMRELLDEGGLPQPDRIEYGHTCIRMFWHDTKSVVVVDIDEPDEPDDDEPDEPDEQSRRRRTRSAAEDRDPDRSELP